MNFSPTYVKFKIKDREGDESEAYVNTAAVVAMSPSKRHPSYTEIITLGGVFEVKGFMDETLTHLLPRF